MLFSLGARANLWVVNYTFPDWAFESWPWSPLPVSPSMLFRLSGLSDPLEWGAGKVYGFNCYIIRCVYISVYIYIYIYIYMVSSPKHYCPMYWESFSFSADWDFRNLLRDEEHNNCTCRSRPLSITMMSLAASSRFRTSGNGCSVL